MPILRRIRNRADSRLTDVVLADAAVRRMAQVFPLVVILMGIEEVPHLSLKVVTVMGNVAMAFMVIQMVRSLLAMLDALLLAQHQNVAGDGQTVAMKVRSIKSYVQLGKLILMVAAAIIAAATLFNRSPLIVLSGLGAMSAVLMLVFKDTILSFTAGVLLSSNDMLRLGDWIEMPQVGADGDVVDIALHTVKVQNWDKTITTIPTWRLMSESYRNWRGMSESGGRRIKRTLRLDASSVRFLEDADIAYLSNIALLRPYLQGKRATLTELNSQARVELGEKGAFPANQHRLTNIGTFRAYIEVYLRGNPRVHQAMTLMVRTLEPTPEGVPIEVYCFTASTAWMVYESTQGDIFDHLLAILPEFGLRLYQSPTGNDLRIGMTQRAETVQALRKA
ncbi:MAG: mechanosensitive ion channel family protein [Polaromonas sp.]|nr:mechanosensitive ion channel family protein [Polaromonas sp.]